MEREPIKEEVTLIESQRAGGHAHDFEREETREDGLTPYVCKRRNCAYGVMIDEAKESIDTYR